MAELSGDTLVQANRFQPIGEQTNIPVQTTASQPVQNEKPAQKVDKEINFEGWDKTRNFIPIDADLQAATNDVPSEADKQQIAEKTEQQLIFGKFKTLEEAEKSYKGLERKLHDPATRAEMTKKERELQERLSAMEIENTYYKKHNKVEDRMSPEYFNKLLSENPGQGMVEILKIAEEQRRVADAVKAQEDYSKRTNDEMLNNISYMEREYPDFASHKQKLADWMRYYHMDSTAIVADKEKLQNAYRDYIDAYSDIGEIASEQRQVGMTEAIDKMSQMPAGQGSGSLTMPQNSASLDGRLTPVSNGQQPQQKTVVDPLDIMEGRMKIHGDYKMF